MTGDGRRCRLHRLEQLRSGDEHHSGAGDCEEHSAVARIKVKIMASPFDGSDGDGVGHQPGFRPRLDREESTDFAQHRNH
jgi:hypothetical protein